MVIRNIMYVNVISLQRMVYVSCIFLSTTNAFNIPTQQYKTAPPPVQHITNTVTHHKPLEYKDSPFF